MIIQGIALAFVRRRGGCAQIARRMLLAPEETWQ
jgi:hypothetical protein